MISTIVFQYGSYEFDDDEDDEDGEDEEFIGSDPTFCSMVNCNAVGAPKQCPTKCGRHGNKILYIN